MPQGVRPVLSSLSALAGVSLALVMLTASPARAHPFDDTAGTYLAEAVGALESEGVVRGCTSSQYCPFEPVTRAQVASLLARALELPAADDAPFDDVTGGVHAASINAVAAAGITMGCTDSLFCPADPINREQMASMLVRAFSPPAANGPWFDDVWRGHEDSVNRLAAAGIGAGCGDPLTHFCARDTLTRAHMALFLARALDLVDRVEVAPLHERRTEQERIDDERRVSDREAIWDALAECESNGNWSANTGNGYYGGLQFLPETWWSVGGAGLPHQHPRSEQIHRGEILQQRSGWGQWPACSRKLGLR